MTERDAFTQEVASVRAFGGALEGLADGVDRRARRVLAVRVSAHAVADHAQRAEARDHVEAGVFVDLLLGIATRIGSKGELDRDRRFDHRVVRRVCHALTVKGTGPKRSSAPARTGTQTLGAMRAPSTKVPLFEPSSRTYTKPPSSFTCA